MRTNLVYILALFLVLTTSCKDKEKNEESQDTEAPIAPQAKQNFSVELDVMASKKDDFALYYTEDNTINFVGDMALWHGVEGGKRETVVFDMSEEKIPTNIRLDFGMNKEQDSVIVYKVKVSYYGNDFSFNGTDFFKYFIESKDFKTEFDVSNGALKIVKNGPEYKTPFYYPRQELIDAIKKITTAKK